MPDKPKPKTSAKKWRTITLPDGKTVQVAIVKKEN